ncbi:MAG TPA: hypothetical protein PKJ33_03880 [Alphaproteobacteria bacterium]|nr:hypothetical protein [Alphaproteobacteria bacterium]
MFRTSNENLARIIARNNCKDLSELNLLKTITLDLAELDGVINLGEFTKNALEVHITARFSELNTVNYNNYPKEFINLLEKKKKKKSVTLDARFAGEFHKVVFENPMTGYIIDSIKLKYPFQVFNFIINENNMQKPNGLCIQQKIMDAQSSALKMGTFERYICSVPKLYEEGINTKTYFASGRTYLSEYSLEEMQKRNQKYYGSNPLKSFLINLSQIKNNISTHLLSDKVK